MTHLPFTSLATYQVRISEVDHFIQRKPESNQSIQTKSQKVENKLFPNIHVNEGSVTRQGVPTLLTKRNLPIRTSHFPSVARVTSQAERISECVTPPITKTMRRGPERYSVGDLFLCQCPNRALLFKKTKTCTQNIQF